MAAVAVAGIVGALSVFAWQHGYPTATTASAAPVPTFTLGVRTPTPTPTRTAPAVTAPGAEERFLALGSGVMWRATAGACNGAAPMLERSDDGGANWLDVTPGYRDVRQIVALQSFSGTEADIVAGVGDACEVQGLRTYTEGEFWAPDDQVLNTLSYISPSESSTVVTPAGSIDAPCAQPWSVATANDSIAVVCDGTPMVTNGEEWTSFGIPTAHVLAAGEGELVLVFDDSECEGLALKRSPIDGLAGQETRVICLDVDPTASEASAAIATAGGQAVVWAGDSVIAAPQE
ncbi:hypothetical protein P0L94_10310 [Microbacter sp. GSS18]|nr:hypothetical protein P0L94_10310 [Microbacter sp. GSS18]